MAKPWYDNYNPNRKLIMDRQIGPIQVDARLEPKAPYAALGMGVPIEQHDPHRRPTGASPQIDPDE